VRYRLVMSLPVARICSGRGADDNSHRRRPDPHLHAGPASGAAGRRHDPGAARHHLPRTPDLPCRADRVPARRHDTTAQQHPQRAMAVPDREAGEPAFAGSPLACPRRRPRAATDRSHSGRAGAVRGSVPHLPQAEWSWRRRCRAGPQSAAKPDRIPDAAGLARSDPQPESCTHLACSGHAALSARLSQRPRDWPRYRAYLKHMAGRKQPQ